MLHLLSRILRVFWFVILGLSALAVLGIGVSLFLTDTPIDTNLLQSPVSVESFKQVSGAEDITLNPTDRVMIESVTFTSTDPAVLAPMVLIFLIGLGLFLYGYRLLQGIVSSAVQRDPFTTENVTRIRRIALVALAIVVLQFATPLLSALLAGMRLSGTALDAELTLDGDVAGFIIVLILLALAEVFARGVELREENELTI